MGTSNDREGDFTTTISYLARLSLYTQEKPYSADFSPGDGSKQTNHTYDPASVTIRPIRSPESFDLHTHGFCVLQAPSCLDPQDVLLRPREVEEAAYAEAEALLHRHFPEYERIEAMSMTVRKRDPRFPVPEGTTPSPVSHEQPATLPHCDFCLSGKDVQLAMSFPGQLGYFQDKDYDLINIWRPLVGPNDDYPLALCDYTSIRPADDIVNNDDIHRDRVNGNSLLYRHEAHKWYYLEAQRPRDVLVFRNIDSTGKRARGFHCAVDNPLSASPPRQSVEIRLVAFRPKSED